MGDILASEQFDMLKTKVKDLLNKNLYDYPHLSV